MKLALFFSPTRPRSSAEVNHPSRLKNSFPDSPCLFRACQISPENFEFLWRISISATNWQRRLRSRKSTPQDLSETAWKRLKINGLLSKESPSNNPLWSAGTFAFFCYFLHPLRSSGGSRGAVKWTREIKIISVGMNNPLKTGVTRYWWNIRAISCNSHAGGVGMSRLVCN